VDAPKSYKDALNLPTTSLSIRANSAEREPALRAHWDEIALARDYFARQGGTLFVLHDGPPYTNGHLHVGHALNNILKDMVVRARRMAGFDVSFAPGWDCHGLPIELKVVHEIGDTRSSDPVAFKKACRAYATRWQEAQEEERKEFGMVAEWEKRYLTMDPTYEATIIRSLATFAEKGYIERKGKTIPWCMSCQTALASAEIEYAERKDPSCYIKFKMAEKTQADELAQGRALHLLIWTTTPWTIPLNRAVVLNDESLYAVVVVDENNACVISQTAASNESIMSMFGAHARVAGMVPASTFIGKKAQHPLVDGLLVPILGDASVSKDEGTGCLHSAPGCGPEDYLLGVKYGLEIYSPVSAEGTYTAAILPEALAGMPITDGQWWVLRELQERGALQHKSSIKHSYPHCWRCRNGLIFRATDQWFCNLSQHDLVQRAQQSLQEVAFIPSWGKTRLESFISNRTEWCISRQRSWGVPITALYNKVTGEYVLDPVTMRKVADHVAQEGIEYWDRVTIAELRAQGMLPAALQGLTDEQIGKENNILDVWFDSGVSHQAVIAARGGALPVDLYLEGSDQHRGWFQSSLLCSMVISGKPQTKAFLTHGFVVDANGHKMSKSRGNVIDPREVIKKYGVDVLRLWVASVDYERDVVLSEKLLDQTAEMFRKVRNTCRFLLANLYDFNPEADIVPFEKMHLLDRQAMATAVATHQLVKRWFDEYSFSSIVQQLARYCSVELSAHYLDMTKDRLYVEAAAGLKRRSAQTAQYYILTLLNQMIAPLIPYTAEDVFLATPYAKKEKSVHLQRFLSLEVPRVGSSHLWEMLSKLREEVLKQIEQLRVAGIVKQSLEVAVTLRNIHDTEYAEAFDELAHVTGSQAIEEFLNEWFIVSRCTLLSGSQGESTVQVAPAGGAKCPRCWHWFEQGADLCERCQGLLGG